MASHNKSQPAGLGKMRNLSGRAVGLETEGPSLGGRTRKAKFPWGARDMGRAKT